MKTTISLLLLSSMLLFGSHQYDGSTTAAVTLVGGLIKNKYIENNTKFKRKNCPVCKGSGKYLSGDGIKMVDCGYCEPEINSNTPQPSISIQKPVCDGPECKLQQQQQPRSVIIKRQ